jgi:hypothetical protein
MIATQQMTKDGVRSQAYRDFNTQSDQLLSDATFTASVVEKYHLPAVPARRIVYTPPPPPTTVAIASSPASATTAPAPAPASSSCQHVSRSGCHPRRHVAGSLGAHHSRLDERVPRRPLRTGSSPPSSSSASSSLSARLSSSDASLRRRNARFRFRYLPGYRQFFDQGTPVLQRTYQRR